MIRAELKKKLNDFLTREENDEIKTALRNDLYCITQFGDVLGESNADKIAGRSGGKGVLTVRVIPTVYPSRKAAKKAIRRTIEFYEGYCSLSEESYTIVKMTLPHV